jgi:hypothetical protein
VVAGVTAGHLTLEMRRGVMRFSRSMGLWLGEELEECVPSRCSEVLRQAESMVEEVGTEDDMAFELDVLDKFTVEEPCRLRPLLCGVMVSAFVNSYATTCPSKIYHPHPFERGGAMAPRF